MKIALKIIGLAAAAVIAVIAWLAILGIPAGVMNATVADRIARDTGARVSFNGATRIGLFPLRLVAHDLSVVPAGDDPLQITIERVEAAIPLASLISREPTASAVTLTRPLLRAPLIRNRARNAGPAAAPTPLPGRVLLERLIVTDGAVVLTDTVAKVEQRIDGISADVQVAGDRRVTMAGRARLGDAPASFTMRTRWPAAADRQPTQVEVSFDAPGVMTRTIAATADVKLTGAVLSLSNLSGRLGDDAFNGWASAELSGKPLVKLDLDFPQLHFDAPQWRGRGETSWSTKPFDLAGLNYADAQGRVSIAEMKIGALRVVPAALDLTLAAGALQLKASHLGVGGGEIDGDVVIDASGAAPDISLRADIANVRARPLLNSLAGFDRIDGRMTAKLALRGTGISPRAVAASLGGTAFTSITDGQIIGINFARMIRTLTASTLAGWQEASSETTDLSQLSASLRLENGQGTTSDLMLAGPLVRMTGAGNIDLVSETMAFRVEPKLVMTLQGQSAPGAAPAATPVGLGVPVVVQGPWASPRIYPEISGMLDNPDAAYAQLRQMGQGLFGRDLLGKDLGGLIGGAGSGDAAAGQNGLGGAIGNIIQGLGAPGPAGKTPPMGQKPSDPDANPMNDIMKRLFGK